jgi:N6-adenine-specific methylase
MSLTAITHQLSDQNNLVLFCGPGFSEQAKVKADAIGVVFAGERETLKFERCPIALWLDAQGLSLRQAGRKAMGPVYCDFVEGEARHRRLFGGGKSQLIAKAVGIKEGIRPSIVDLTAGLGGDAFVFASLGCQVTLVERNPIVAALLDDGFQRARIAAEVDADLQQVMARMTLVHSGASDWLKCSDTSAAPQVIFLDPMFPERKKSAQVNKSMQVFHHIVGSDEDADQLLPQALAVASHRVVVKRPARAPWLNGQEPGYVLSGKSVRFDIYPLRSLTPL